MLMKGSNRNATLLICFPPETPIKRQATQHDCPSILLGAGGTKEVEKCTVRKKYFVLGQLEQPRQDKNLLYRHHEPIEPTKEGLHSYILLDSPFASASTVSRGHPTLVSLVAPCHNYSYLSFSSGRWQDLPVFADKCSKAKTTSTCGLL
jgi:hypothetical protein